MIFDSTKRIIKEMEYLKKILQDTSFHRLVMAIWSLPFILVLIFCLAHIQQLKPDYWLMLFPMASGFLGVWLLYSSLYASDETIDKRLSALAEGGEILGVVLVLAVILIALPLWVIKNAVSKK